MKKNDCVNIYSLHAWHKKSAIGVWRSGKEHVLGTVLLLKTNLIPITAYERSVVIPHFTSKI